MKDETKLTVLGRDSRANHGIVNPPVYHASTILFPTVEALRNRNQGPGKKYTYGLHGTPTTYALEDAVAELEGGHDAVLTPSGLASITLVLTALLGCGDHLLVLDAVYGPTRRFCDNTLTRFGVETTYYDPLLGEEIADLIRPETKVIFVESPASNSFEVQDIPAIARAAHAAGALVVMDNTWASPLFFKPFEHGVDVSIQAGTKYISGHADVMLGSVAATEEVMGTIRKVALELGLNAAPDDCYLALRGLRTMAVRLGRHQETGLALARWLVEQPEVARVIHPALPSDQGYRIWKRDFLGASGLFGVVLRSCSDKAVAAMLDGLEFFGMGFSWGGYESLILPTDPGQERVATTWETEGPCLRIHAGLEDVEDLKEDLRKGLDRLNQAS